MNTMNWFSHMLAPMENGSHFISFPKDIEPQSDIPVLHSIVCCEIMPFEGGTPRIIVTSMVDKGSINVPIGHLTVKSILCQLILNYRDNGAEKSSDYLPDYYPFEIA